jgi:hypothetical protein
METSKFNIVFAILVLWGMLWFKGVTEEATTGVKRLYDVAKKKEVGTIPVAYYGALRAAKWLKGKPAGLYDMFDVLGLR